MRVTHVYSFLKIERYVHNDKIYRPPDGGLYIYSLLILGGGDILM